MAMSHSRCIPPHERIDQVMNEVNNIVITGATYTAGDGIDAAQLALNIIQASIDGVTIIFDAGVMKAVAASDLVAGCGADITGGVISVTTDGTTIDCIGGNLTVIVSSFGTILVSGEDAVVASIPSDSFTLATVGNAEFTTDAGTKTITLTVVPYLAGTLLDLSGSTFNVDLTEATGYDAGEYRLLGQALTSIEFQDVADWLRTLDGYVGTDNQYLNNDNGDIRWVTAAEC